MNSSSVFAWVAFVHYAATGAPASKPAKALPSWLELVPVSLSCPTFELEGLSLGGAAAVRSEGPFEDGEPLRLVFKPLSAGHYGSLEVELFLQWSAEEKVLRKWARYRLVPSQDPALALGASSQPSLALQTRSPLLKHVTLDVLDAGKAGLITDCTREFAPASDSQSRPVFLKGLFVGVEFPIAATRLESDKVILAHRPGKRLQPGTWYETRKAVYGLTSPGAERAAFDRYLSAHRPGPRGLHVNYNSWWTSPLPYSQKDILQLMSAFEEKLWRPLSVSFDTFCIDLGWSLPRGLWEIDPRTFPEGFAQIQKAAERMNSRLGLWVSPSNCYSPGSFSNTWAAMNGYETFARGAQRFTCLAGPRYAHAFRERLVEMATRYNICHFKFDGYVVECPEDTHGHEPGPLSAEAVAEGIIAAFTAIHQAAPDAWLETTCFGWNPSPWWLFHVNSIIGTFGDDCPVGRSPCPVYRESYTTARDYYNLQGAAWLAAPIWAQEVLGIIHQSDEPFLNDAVMTLMRGHMFLPVYMHPKYMNDARWQSFAKFLKWARQNAPRLEQARALLPASWGDGNAPKFTNDAPMPREPYGYAHYHDGKTLVALRNPWIEPRRYRLDLAEIAQTPASVPAPVSVVSLYPEPRLYADNVGPDTAVEIPLAPYETVVLSVTSKQATAGLPRASDLIRHALDMKVFHCESGHVRFDGPAEAMGPDWTSPVGGVGPATQLQLEAEAVVHSPRAEVLILLEDNKPLAVPWHRLTIDGTEIETASSGSSTGFSATGLAVRENWLFLRAPLKRGASQVRLELWIEQESPKVSVWVWAHRAEATAPADYPNRLPAPELISLDAISLADLAQMPTPATQPAVVARPITRIDGIFLDAVEPVSVSQGYGKLQKNRSVAEQPLTIGVRRFARGLGTHAPARIVYHLDGQYRRFQSWAGADNWTSPTITMEIHLDGQKRWESGLMTRSDPAKWVDIDVEGAKTLELIVGDAGNTFTSDHADWAEARLLR